jgi:hypothetical protein
MGRGLSELQRTILIMARENRERHGLGPVEYYVTFSHPDLSFHPPDGCSRLATSDRFEAWRESRCRPEYLAERRRKQKAMSAEIRQMTAELRAREELWAKFHPDRPASGPPRDPPLTHRPTDEEEDRVMRMIESLDDLGSILFDEDMRLPVTMGGTRRGSLPVCESARAYLDRREADVIVEALQARGLEAEVRCETIPHADLYSWEVLGRVYGFERHRKPQLGGPAATHWPDRAQLEQWGIPDDEKHKEYYELAGHRRSSGKFYDVKAIGAARYNAAKVATSKAFHRLKAQGLAEIFYWPEHTGLRLSALGVELADQLMTNRDANHKTVSQ